MKKCQVLAVFFAIFIFSCSTPNQAQKTEEITKLTLLHTHIIPFNQSFDKTSVGGLSGIDYNPKKDEYYMISDDRSDINPARFYTAQIVIKNDKIDTVIFIKNTFLKDRLGNFYPNRKQDAYHTPDPEALRYNPDNNTFIWSSEGDRFVNPQNTILENPSVTEIDASGNYIDTFVLPPQVIMHATDYGPRQNGAFEGLTFSPDYRYLFVSVEEPLYQDGSPAGTGDSSAIVRILKFDMHTKKPVAQYAYQVDPVAYPAIPPSAFKINGISDILYSGDDKLLVMERSYSTGSLHCTIKVYLADLSQGEDISKIDSLQGKEVKLIPKKLLLNMDQLGIFIDNVEGMTFGPKLSNGKNSLVFIADNNFNFFEQSQVLLFQIN